MPAALSVLAVLCTVHYFYAFLQRPALLGAIFSTTSMWKMPLVALYRFGVALGISGMMFLGVKEVFYFVTSHRLGISYDDYIGGGAIILALFLLRGFERTARAMAASRPSEAPSGKKPPT
jgi:hypothetical protein